MNRDISYKEKPEDLDKEKEKANRERDKENEESFILFFVAVMTIIVFVMFFIRIVSAENNYAEKVWDGQNGTIEINEQDMNQLGIKTEKKTDVPITNKYYVLKESDATDMNETTLHRIIIKNNDDEYKLATYNGKIVEGVEKNGKSVVLSTEPQLENQRNKYYNKLITYAAYVSKENSHKYINDAELFDESHDVIKIFILVIVFALESKLLWDCIINIERSSILMRKAIKSILFNMAIIGITMPIL